VAVSAAGRVALSVVMPRFPRSGRRGVLLST
jgi:hypothetical protein